MFLDYDEARFPGLARFRRALLANDLATAGAIAREKPDWYAMENPDDGLSLAELARRFRAQHYASEGLVDELAALLAEEPALIDAPWTAQNWRLLSQAATYGHLPMVEWLLEQGADVDARIDIPPDDLTIREYVADPGFRDREIAERILGVRSG